MREAGNRRSVDTIPSCDETCHLWPSTSQGHLTVPSHQAGVQVAWIQVRAKCGFTAQLGSSSQHQLVKK